MTEQPPPPPPREYGAPVPPPPPAGFPRPAELVERFLARLIDGILVGVVFGILAGIGSALFLRGFVYSTGEYFLYWTFVSIVSVGVTMAYYGYLESTQGATLGKSLLKLKVVGPDGVSNPTMEQSLRRNAFYLLQLAFIVPIVGTFFGGLAQLAAVIYIAVTINNDTVKRQGWHDQFAGGTQVLKVS